MNFPVSCGTPMISPLVKWEHSENWHVTNFGNQISSGQRSTKVSLSYKEFEYFSGHNIDGENFDNDYKVTLIIYFISYFRKSFSSCCLLFVYGLEDSSNDKRCRV